MLDRTPTRTNAPPFRRMHLFEFGDLNIPQVFHDLMTDILGQLAKMGLYNSVIPIIKGVLEEEHCSSIVDMCTGSGEPAILLKEKLSKDYNLNFELVLTDKFPNLAKAKELNSIGDVTYLTGSIDATALPEELTGLRTLFASLHHFKPEQVQAILQDAVNKNQPIAALEFTERTWLRVFFMIPGTLHMLLMTPFIKPFSLTRLLWTYVIPVMPLIYFWDGLVSNLRTYSVGELDAIIAKLENNHFSWEVKTIPTALWPVNTTYLIGRPALQEHLMTTSELQTSREENISTEHTRQASASIYKHAAWGILAGLGTYLATNDSRVTFAVATIVTMSSWVLSKDDTLQYGRFFNRLLRTENNTALRQSENNQSANYNKPSNP